MQPKVTLIVAMLNEAEHIEACLRSILAQNYPAGRLEILVYDGGSTDRSRDIVQSMLSENPSIVLAHNPRRTQAAGWNLGIGRASGEIVGIVGAHSEIAPDYVAKAIDTLERTGADLVGGPMRAVAKGTFGRAVALATSSPFGVGGARFHYTDHEEQVDTVYMGLARAQVYAALGFDEEMVRNQDDELSYRLLDRGGTIVCNPAIRSVYRNRATWRGLARQYFQYGYWKVLVVQKHPRQTRLRHLVPAAFVGVLVGGLSMAVVPVPYVVPMLTTVIISYGVSDLGATLLTARRSAASSTLLLPLVFPTMHLAYGLGFWVGLLAATRRPRRPSATRVADASPAADGNGSGSPTAR
jgi:succinoglycan biosynthesis protein ExoA